MACFSSGVRRDLHGALSGTDGGRRSLAVTLAALGCLGFGGCAHYVSRPIEPARTATELSARSLADEGLHRFIARADPGAPLPWPAPRWDLAHLTLAAYYFQPGLAVARAQWDVATAGTITAGQRPNPSVSASATYDTTTPPPWIPAVTFDLPIETAGKRSRRLSQARELAAAARWDWVDKAWQVRAGVRSALLGVYSARETTKLLANQETAQAEVVRLLEGQLRAGSVAAVETTQARIALESTRLSLQQARQSEIEAQAALADAIGVPAAALRKVEISFASLDEFPPAVTAPEVRGEAVLHRADVRSALANYAASQSALQLEIANQYPDIHLGPGYELDQTDNKWTLGLTVPLPVLNRNEGPIAEAKARRRLAAARFIEVQARAIAEADLALSAYRAAEAQSATAAALRQNLRQRLDSVRAMQRAGEVDPLAVASAEVEYANGAQLQLAALIKAQQALGRLEAAVQSPRILPEEVLHQAESTPRADESHEP